MPARSVLDVCFSHGPAKATSSTVSLDHRRDHWLRDSSVPMAYMPLSLSVYASMPMARRAYERYVKKNTEKLKVKGSNGHVHLDSRLRPPAFLLSCGGLRIPLYRSTLFWRSAGSVQLGRHVCSNGVGAHIPSAKKKKKKRFCLNSTAVIITAAPKVKVCDCLLVFRKKILLSTTEI